ncbi:hypothetical protein IQ06DRAFT_118337 [Phaeosphaeriaceae sp. SRC1lsM3a]|nr:hypothetical protein IQ06DRAFT_118337 [Stagonospora sp. SRC1lsM3a]
MWVSDCATDSRTLGQSFAGNSGKFVYSTYSRWSGVRRSVSQTQCNKGVGAVCDWMQQVRTVKMPCRRHADSHLFILCRRQHPLQVDGLTREAGLVPTRANHRRASKTRGDVVGPGDALAAHEDSVACVQSTVQYSCLGAASSLPRTTMPSQHNYRWGKTNVQLVSRWWLKGDWLWLVFSTRSGPYHQSSGGFLGVADC